ncbi:uncharacterized protein [Apostichopus japonicus]|uniref:uncharacterized protein isoform X2 n=1 Tax=Stichopus japonicus TaxID=307972 RepID=UPI003AB8DBA9
MEKERKYVSVEVKYGIHLKVADVRDFMYGLCLELHKRLQKLAMTGRTLTIKLKVRKAGTPREDPKSMGYGMYHNKIRSATLSQETDDLDEIYKECMNILLQMDALPTDIQGVGVQISRLEKRIDNSCTDSTPNLSLQNDADTKSSSKSTNGLRTVSPEGFNLELPSTDNGHSSVFDRKKKPLILNSPHDTGVQTNCSKSNEVRSNMIFVGNETNEGKSLQVQNTQDDLKEVARTQEGNSQILVPQGPLEYRLPRPQVPFDLIPANDHVDGSPYVRSLTNHGKEEAADGGYNLEKKGTSEIPSADAGMLCGSSFQDLGNYMEDSPRCQLQFHSNDSLESNHDDLQNSSKNFDLAVINDTNSKISQGNSSLQRSKDDSNSQRLQEASKPGCLQQYSKSSSSEDVLSVTDSQPCLSLSCQDGLNERNSQGDSNYSSSPTDAIYRSSHDNSSSSSQELSILRNFQDSSNNRCSQVDSNFISSQRNGRESPHLTRLPLRKRSKHLWRNVHPEFLPDFWRKSRYHHLSTWRLEHKQFVNSLQKDKQRRLPGKEKLRALMKTAEMQEDLQERNEHTNSCCSSLPSQTSIIPERDVNSEKLPKERNVIMHIDIDCFFVAVSLLNRPDLIGKPLAVTGPASVQRPRGMDTWLEDSKGAYLEKGILTCAKANSIVNSSREEICQQISLSQRIREDEESGTSEHQVRNGQFVSKEQRLHIGKNIDSEQHLCNQWKENNIEMEDGAKCRKDMTDGARNEDDVSMVVSVGSCQLFNPLAEIASCSYEAREFGVGKGMLLSKAKELCPHLHTVAYDFEGYHRVSKLFYETVASFTSNIEAISCDELYIDVTKTLMETGASPLEFAQLVKDEIFAKTQCTASVGIGSNTLLAKICTQRAKPNGIYLLEEDKVDEFMKRLPVTELKGVGEVTNNKLKSLGISTCAELQRLSLPALQFHFGQKIGQDLYEHCRGQRDQPIRVERKQKVVSATINYGIRFSGFAEALKFVSNLAEAVQKKLKKSGLAGRTITLKLKVRKKDAPDLDPRYLGYGECDNKSRAKTLRQETDDLCIIQRETQNLLLQSKASPRDIRGVAVLMSLLKKVSSSSKRIKSLKDMLIKKGSEVKKTPSLIAERSEVTEPSEMVARKAEAKHFPSSAEKSSTYTNVTTVFQTEQPSSVLHDTANGKLEPVKSPNKTLQLESGFDQQFGHDHPQPASPSSAVVTQDGLSSPLLKPLTMFSPKPDTSKRRNLSTGDLPTENSSSLDPDVLKELPPDILREVLEEERSKVKKAENLVKTFGHVDDLPSFTEIDPTCLDALPAEILGELLSAYRRRVLASEKTPKKSPQNMFEIYKLREKQRELSRARKVRKCVKNSRGKSSVQRSLFEVMNIQSAKVKLRRHSALC